MSEAESSTGWKGWFLHCDQKYVDISPVPLNSGTFFFMFWTSICSSNQSKYECLQHKVMSLRGKFLWTAWNQNSGSCYGNRVEWRCSTIPCCMGVMFRCPHTLAMLCTIDRGTSFLRLLTTGFVLRRDQVQQQSCNWFNAQKDISFKNTNALSPKVPRSNPCSNILVESSVTPVQELFDESQTNFRGMCYVLTDQCTHKALMVLWSPTEFGFEDE